MQEKEKLIELKDLQITFGTGKKKFVAVDHVNFDIYKGETFALVGSQDQERQRSDVRLRESTRYLPERFCLKGVASVVRFPKNSTLK